jgi:hypothetical protein
MTKVAVLISTYDGASDLWAPLEKTYQKYWEDCPYDIFLTNNNKMVELEKFKLLHVGKEKSWSDNIYKSLLSVSAEYILLTFDDLFLYKTLSTRDIEELIDWGVEKKVSYLQLYPSISRGDIVEENERIIEKHPGSNYRNATVFSLWKKDVLLELLDIEENAWQFETLGSDRAAKLNGFYGVRDKVIPYLNGVVKGKWNPKVKKYLINEGLDIDTKREEFTFSKFLRYESIRIMYSVKRYIIGVLNGR